MNINLIISCALFLINNVGFFQVFCVNTIKPRIFHADLGHEVNSTLESNGQHSPKIRLEFKHRQKNVILDLVLNQELLSENHFIAYQTKRYQDLIIQSDNRNCHYQGKLRGNFNSNVAISTCNGEFRGVLFDGYKTFFIDRKKNGDHIMRRHSSNIYNSQFHRRTKRHFIRNIQNSLQLYYSRETSWRNDHLFVELILVVDNKIFWALGGSLKNVHHYCKDVANVVDIIYKPLNISVVLTGVVVWNEFNPILISKKSTSTLKKFLTYRQLVLNKIHPNDNAQLLTYQNFEKGVVGKSRIHGICTSDKSGGLAAAFNNTAFGFMGAVVAHELGHNLGIDHDTEDCHCNADNCIMSDTGIANHVPFDWSSCSVSYVRRALKLGLYDCLRNYPNNSLSLPVCGNGILEYGEQCDCGTANQCNSSCCDSRTCTFRHSGTVCRKAKSVCDIVEYCTGDHQHCPDDRFLENFEVCGNGSGKGHCFKNSCVSRNIECQKIWGPSAHSPEQCYIKNIYGNRFGNCRYNNITREFIACAHEDTKCGRLHCAFKADHWLGKYKGDVEFQVTHSGLHHTNGTISCFNVVYSSFTQFGLVPNGAKCGDGKMCFKQQCLPIERIKEFQATF